jgi:hypothetical protein
MDEITLFKTIQPPPPGDPEAIRQGARTRLTAAMSRPPRPARHRRTPLVLAGAVAAAGALTVSGILLSAGGPVSGQAPRAVHVNLAAWSVNTNRNGTVTFKVRRIFDAARLEHVLAEAGVPAVVRWGENCRAQRTLVGPPLRKALSGPTYVGGPDGGPQWVNGRPYPDWAYTITPSAMPKGARFMISVGPGPAKNGHRHWPKNPWFDWAIVPAGAHVTCGPSVPPVVCY